SSARASSPTAGLLRETGLRTFSSTKSDLLPPPAARLSGTRPLAGQALVGSSRGRVRRCRDVGLSPSSMRTSATPARQRPIADGASAGGLRPHRRGTTPHGASLLDIAPGA